MTKPQAEPSFSGPATGGAGATPRGRLDPRCKLVLAAGVGLLAWRAGPAGLAIFALGLSWALVSLRVWRRRTMAPLRPLVVFVLAWTFIGFGLNLWEGRPLVPALAESAMLGLRLALLAGVGVALSLAASARELGLAVTWFLRPVLGKRSWQPALALALMIHFLPLAWTAMTRTRQAMALRTVHGWRRRVLTPLQAGLRFLAGKTWERTLAVASRGLDRPEAWRPDFARNGSHWLLTGGLLAAGYGAALL